MDRKMYWGIAALIVVLIAAGGFIYYQWSQVQQLKEEVAQDKKQLEEENKPVAENDLPTPDPGKKWVPHGDHFHQVPIDAPDVWQGEPVVSDVEVTPEVVAKPDWIYDPDREQPDGWDPKLVWEGGEATIDFNYFRALTEAEQAEYERLKATENPEDHGLDVNDEASLRLIAIVNMQTELSQQIGAARGTPEVDKLLAEYDRLYGRFPVSD